MYESPSLFGGDIFRQSPGTARVNPQGNAWDMKMPGSGGGGGGGIGGTKGATPFVGGSMPPGALAGSGPGLGNQVPKRMKKMPKK